jgi:hypothetical protein
MLGERQEPRLLLRQGVGHGLIAAARGRVNSRFWRSIYKLDDSSGGPFVTGWILAFFRYRKDSGTAWATRPNPWLGREGQDLEEMRFGSKARAGMRLTLDAFPAGLAVPAAPAGIRRAAVGPGGQEEGAHAVGERG